MKEIQGDELCIQVQICTPTIMHLGKRAVRKRKKGAIRKQEEKPRNESTRYRQGKGISMMNRTKSTMG